MSARTILVTGSTGNQGSALVKLLAKQNEPKIRYKILAVTRDPSVPKSQALAPLPGVELMKGDDANLEALFAQQVDGVFHMAPAYAQNEVATGKAIVDLCVKHNVGHLVYSGVDLGGDPNYGQIISHIHTTSLKYSIINPACFMDNFYAPMILHSVANPAIYKPGSSRKLIAASDIGAAAAEAFIHPEVWIGKQLDLAGDDLTPQEIVDMFQEVKGMDISGKQVGLPPFLRIMFDNRVEFAADVEECRRLVPGLKDPRTWLKTEFSRIGLACSIKNV